MNKPKALKEFLDEHSAKLMILLENDNVIFEGDSLDDSIKDYYGYEVATALSCGSSSWMITLGQNVGVPQELEGQVSFFDN